MLSSTEIKRISLHHASGFRHRMERVLVLHGGQPLPPARSPVPARRPSSLSDPSPCRTLASSPQNRSAINSPTTPSPPPFLSSRKDPLQANEFVAEDLQTPPSIVDDSGPVGYPRFPFSLLTFSPSSGACSEAFL
jgi:hypothetical protein